MLRRPMERVIKGAGLGRSLQHLLLVFIREKIWEQWVMGVVL